MPVLRFPASSHRLLAAMLVPAALVAVVQPAHASTPRVPQRDAAVATQGGAPAPSHLRMLADLDHAVSSHLLDPEVLRELRRTGSVEVMIATTDPTSGKPGLGLAERERSLRSSKPDLPATGARLLHDYSALPLRHARFSSEKALLHVLRDPRVTTISLPAEGTTAGAVSDTESLSLVGRDRLSSGWSGAGSYVAILDTGAYIGNAPFGCTAVNTPAGCKVAGSYEYGPIDNQADWPDSPHGTNVAGVVANVAPGASLIIQDVFRTVTNPTTGKLEQSWDEAYIAAAINDLIRWKGQGFNVVAANMSLGMNPSYWTGTCSSTLSTSLANLRAAGIIPVVAAGNEAVNKAGAYVDGVSNPACAPDAFVVGAVADGGADASAWNCPAGYAADTIACFSQGGTLVDVLAPGLAVDAAGVHMAGTSQATPHVSGAIALLAQARPGAPASWLKALRNSGPVLYDRRSGTARPTPRLDLVAAVTAVQSTDVTAPSLTTPRQGVAAGYSADTTGRVPVRLSWSATDASGITAYDAWLKANGTWVALGTGGRGETASVRMLTPGGTYQLAVRARDAAGNWTGWAYGAVFGVSRIDDASTVIVRSAGWTRSSFAGTTGGTYLASATAGATLTVPFTGRGVAVEGLTWPATGQVRVYLDGTLVQTVDTASSSTLLRREIFSRQVAYGAHTLVLEVVGTAGRPTVAIDAIDVLT